MLILLQFSQEQVQGFEGCYNGDECLHRLQFEHDLAVAASRIHVKTLSVQHKIFCFDESQNIHDYSITFLIRRDFPLKSQFVELFSRISSTGLVMKWKKDLIDRKWPNQLPEGYFNFYPAFVFMSGFLVPSMALVAIEIYIFRKSHSESPGRIWIRLEKLVIGRREYFLLEPIRPKDVRNWKITRK